MAKIETNELSKNARGGTELMLEKLYKHVDNQLLDQFQIIPSRVRELDPDRKKILYLHDLPNDPESNHLADAASRSRFDGFVCVSDWQMQMYNLIHGLPYSSSTVLKNAIEPIVWEDVDKAKPTDKINIVYHTTPHRGLQLLIPVFEHIQKVLPVHLHVYSSFKIYGWAERDKEYEALFDKCRANPDITYYGSVSNEEIRKILPDMHVFAYPSIWPETSCIAAIEAMSAKNIVVHPNYAALPETCAAWGHSYQWSEDKSQHASRFAETLFHTCSALLEYPEDLNRWLNSQKQYYDTYYDWNFRAQQWTNYLESMVEKK